MPKKVFVGNLAPHVTEKELVKLFKKCGRIYGVKVVQDSNRRLTRNRGFGFVTFTDELDADNAVRDMDACDFEGRRLAVSIADDQQGHGRVGQRKQKRLAEKEAVIAMKSVGRIPQPHCSNELQHTTALAILPHGPGVDAIQRIRKKHDRQIGRWMPHINVMYPFVKEEHFDALAPYLEHFLQGVPPFTLSFKEFGYFKQQKECVVWLKPEVKPSTSLAKMMAMLRIALPEVAKKMGDRPFSPHLTVGQFKDKRAAESFIEEASQSWEGIECTMNVCSLISRPKDGPFVVKNTIPFGGDGTGHAAASAFDIDTKGLSGAHLPKCPTSHSVINIIPPRPLWGIMQRLRTLHVRESRCGPHLSFIDPFVMAEDQAEAAAVLRNLLADFPPITITLDKFNYFVHKKSATLFVEPEVDPPDALEHLIRTIAAAFPQCTDTVKKSSTGRYIAHMSIAKFESEEELLREKAAIERAWTGPISFPLDELYVLSRTDGDPFAVTEVIPMGGFQGPPHFGPGSDGDIDSPKMWGLSADDEKMSRSLMVGGIPKVWPKDAPCVYTDLELLSLFTAEGFQAVKAEMCLNPDGKHRTCGVVEFMSRDAARQALQTFTAQPFPNYTIYVKPLGHMVFPGAIGDCCSFKAVKDSMI